MNRLENKVAIVTGAGTGIGEAIAKLFLEEGASVMLADVNVCPVAFTAGAKVDCLSVDVSKKDEVELLVSHTVEKFGGLDIIVNNAGVGLTGEIATMSDEVWERVIAVNLSGVFYCMRSASANMLTRKVGGSIINIASILGAVGFATAGAYSASKGGVNQLTRTGAIELAKSGIRVNSIAPGFIKTNMTKAMQDNEAVNKLVTGATPMGRMGDPMDIAYAAVYLASDESTFVTGSVLYVDGGWTAQ